MLNAVDLGDFIDGNHGVYSNQPGVISPNAIILFFCCSLKFCQGFLWALTFK